MTLPDMLLKANGIAQTACEIMQVQQAQIGALRRTQAHLIAAISRILDGLLCDDSDAAADAEALRRARAEISELERLYGSGDEAEARGLAEKTKTGENVYDERNGSKPE